MNPGLRGKYRAQLPNSRDDISNIGKLIRGGGVRQREAPTESHPLVVVHPVSRRPSLFVNPAYTVGIYDAGGRDGDPAVSLRSYRRRAFRVPSQMDVEHSALVGQSLHYADGGYDSHLRVIASRAVAGGKPVAANVMVTA
jgi:taurine dioxygenase